MGRKSTNQRMGETADGGTSRAALREPRGHDELSLTSPLFRELGPSARELLGVIAFFPQGVNEDNINWLFPTISNGPDIFDKFCTLSLTYRSDGFITMLASLRDHLRPKDPTSSLLLSATKEHYFSRLSIYIRPGKSGFEESQWITSEDVNVEHLLDVFTSIDADSESVWGVCAQFMSHLYWHKPRLVAFGSKIEVLPDDHPSKPKCLWALSSLFQSIGNWVECKRLLTHNLKLGRERGDVFQVAATLGRLSDVNRLMGCCEEGAEQINEASKIFERFGDVAGQARCLITRADYLRKDGQLDAAEEAASRAVDLFSEKGDRFRVCEGHRTLGKICYGKGDTEKAIRHFEIALVIGSSLKSHSGLYRVHFFLAELLYKERRFDDSHAHVEQAKSHAVNGPYLLAKASLLQAWFWYEQDMLEKAKSEALRVLNVFEELGSANYVKSTRELLRRIDHKAQGNGLGSSHT